MPKKIIYRANVILEGTTYLLHHKCGVIEKKASSSTTDYSEEWKKGTYINSESGNVAVSSLNLEAMMKDASRGHKISKTTLIKIMAAGVEVEQFDSDILFNGKPFTIKDIEKNEWLFSCAAVVQKQRIMRTRSSIPPGWTLNFTVKVYNPLLKKDILHDLFDRAGHEIGLMDWRPGSSKPGKFGQFELIEFKVC